MKVCDFNKDLEFSKDNNFINIYKMCFGEDIEVEYLNDYHYQKQGIDCKIIFPDGQELFIEEKKRRKYYNDILLEIWSNVEDKKPGWVKYSQADYLCIMFADTKIFLMLDMYLIKLAWKKYDYIWLVKYKPILVKNRSYSGSEYTTENRAIPKEELLEAMKECSLEPVK